MPRKDNDTITNYKEYPLTNNPTTFATKKLDKVIDLIDIMTTRHTKVLVTRLDLHYPIDINSDGTNHDFTKAMNTFTKEFTHKKIDVQYVAKREQVKSKNPHYHVAIAIDGSKRCNRNNIIRDIEPHWAKAIGVNVADAHSKQIVHPCNQDPQGNPRVNGYMLRRNGCGFAENKKSTIRQLSYLCKVDDNDVTPSSTRKFFVSQYKQEVRGILA